MTIPCECCGETFLPIPEAWGAAMCGQCIATRIELELRSLTGTLTPKPAKRAPPAEVDGPDVVIAERRA